MRNRRTIILAVLGAATVVIQHTRVGSSRFRGGAARRRTRTAPAPAGRWCSATEGVAGPRVPPARLGRHHAHHWVRAADDVARGPVWVVLAYS